MVQPIAKTFVEIGTDLSPLTKGLATASKGLTSFGKSVASIGTKLTLGISVPIIAIGAASIKSAAEMETLTIAFESLLGSADAAAKVVKDLIDFTAKTPFQLEGVGKAAKQLIAFGVENDQLLNRLKTLGDIAAGANVPLEEMAAIFGKSKAKGKAMTEELLQLSDKGIPIIAKLAESLGVSTEEIFKLASSGKISFPVLLKALEDMTKAGGIFADQMEKQSASIAGLFSTLKDNVALSLAEFGKELAKTIKLKKVIESLTKSVQGMTTSFGDLTPESKQMIFIFGGIAAALGPLLVLVGGLSIAMGALGVSGLAGLGIFAGGFLLLAAPVAAVVVAIGAVIGLVVTLIKNWGALGVAAEALGEKLGEDFTDIIDGVRDGFKAMGDTMIDNLNVMAKAITGNRKPLLDTWESLGKESVESFEKGIENLAGVAEAATRRANAAARREIESGALSNIELQASINLRIEGLEESRLGRGLFDDLVIDEEALGLQQFISELAAADAGVLELGTNLDMFGAQTASVFEGLSISILSFGEVMLGVMDQMATGISDSVASAVVDGQNLAQSLQSVMKSIAKTLISQFIKIGIQQATAAATGAAVNQAMTASEIATGGTRTFAGQFAAWSSAPFPLNITAPAQAASSLGQYTAGVSAAGGGGAASFFGDGGIVSSPTLGVIGEAGESEVIAPLSKLERMIDLSGGGTDLIVQVMLDGEMLGEAAVEHASGVIEVQTGIDVTYG